MDLTVTMRSENESLFLIQEPHSCELQGHRCDCET